MPVPGESHSTVLTNAGICTNAVESKTALELQNEGYETGQGAVDLWQTLGATKTGSQLTLLSPTTCIMHVDVYLAAF